MFDPTKWMMTVTAGWAIGNDNQNGWGFDCSVDTSGHVAQLANPATPISGTVTGDTAYPVAFVGRYYDRGPPVRPDHRLTYAEARALSANGLRMIAVWESPYNTTGTPPAQWVWPTTQAYLNANVNSMDGNMHSHGFDDAVLAFRYAANNIRQPPHTPVYFAIDFDAQDVPSIEAYFIDIAAGYHWYLDHQRNLGWDPVPYGIGVYSGAFVLNTCYKQGITSFYWQAVSPGFVNNSNAWGHANTWQRTNSLSDFTVVAGMDADFDSTWGDEGSFQNS
jgi:hypothetical protein